ncbi:MAG: hypothetical protein WBA43_20115 [Elainellaceae cyanobacterium]|jgi:hypothetical protein
MHLPNKDELMSGVSSSLHSFSQAWAKRYVQQVHQPSPFPTNAQTSRYDIAEHLRQELRAVSARAWSKTEHLLAEQVKRHQLPPNLINPWAIAKDVHDIYDQAFISYVSSVTPERFAVNISPLLGHIRAKYTLVDPRVIGFVSMQFHYTGLFLLELATNDQDALRLYFKAIDDHLYMPLQRAYDAAAQHSYESTDLQLVRKLLPQSSAIAHRVVDQVMAAFPHHHCYSGALNSPQVKISSLRDAEMFQTYLWVCILEDNISIVQQELFPLCVMLYPMLNVRWELVRYMLTLMDHEFAQCLDTAQFIKCSTYLDSLKIMFAEDVFASEVTPSYNGVA